MRKLLMISGLALFAACSPPSEPEVFTTSLDVDEAAVGAALTAFDQLTGNDIDTAALLELTASTKMDAEQQQRVSVSFAGEDTSVLYHVWREQDDWVHLYFSSESEALIDTLDVALAPFARNSE